MKDNTDKADETIGTDNANGAALTKVEDKFIDEDGDAGEISYTYDATEHPGDRKGVDIGTARLEITDDGRIFFRVMQRFWGEGREYRYKIERLFRKARKIDYCTCYVQIADDERQSVEDTFAAWNRANRKDDADDAALEEYYKRKEQAQATAEAAK